MSAERVRTLLLRADNLLKGARPERALVALEEALAEADDPKLRELVERRIAAAKGLTA